MRLKPSFGHTQTPDSKNLSLSKCTHDKKPNNGTHSQKKGDPKAKQRNTPPKVRLGGKPNSWGKEILFPFPRTVEIPAIDVFTIALPLFDCVQPFKYPRV
jgi:hypothetical protein